MMPNAAEMIERLARESERQRIRIESLEAQIAEQEAEIARMKAAAKPADSSPPKAG